MLKDRVDELESILDKEMQEVCTAAAEPFSRKIDEILPLTPVKLYKMASEMEVVKQNMVSDLELLNKEVKSVITTYRDGNLKLRGDRMVPEIFKVETKKLTFSNVDKAYSESIDAFNLHAQEMEQGFSALMRELSFMSEHFKMKAEVLKTEKREMYRRDINSNAAIKAAHKATMPVKGAA